jgi:hypothetical protein
MIKSLSPHYITTPFESVILDEICLRYRLQVFVWSGLKQDIPDDAKYEITINNVEQSDGNSTINISRLINDFIDFKAIDSEDGFTNLENSPNQTWVKTQVFYTSQVGVESAIPEHENTNICVKGYGYGMSGVNPTTPTNKILMNINDYTMKEGGTFIVPIVLDESEPPTPPSITIATVTNTVDNLFSVVFTAVGTYSSLTAIVYPNTGGGLPDPVEFITIDATSPQVIEPSVEITLISNIVLRGYDITTNQYIESTSFSFLPL